MDYIYHIIIGSRSLVFVLLLYLLTNIPYPIIDNKMASSHELHVLTIILYDLSNVPN